MSIIYLDNNATTFMPIEVKQAMIDWCNKGNPSSGHMAARESKRMMNDLREYIGKLCKFDVKSTGDTSSVYKILFTSGASEANCTILHSIVTAYKQTTGRVPHVVISAIEHKSLVEMVKSYESRAIIAATYIAPEKSGHILPSRIKAAIQPDTCLICVMHANNETGAINDVRAIGLLAHRHNIPFHCDTAQTFGKFPIRPIDVHVDSFCISFHKLHGPPGVGALVIRADLITGYKLQPYIYGTQNDGMRGGTENLPGLGAAFIATRFSMLDRLEKNARTLMLKQHIMKSLCKRFPTMQYTSYVNNIGPRHPIEIVFLSGTSTEYLPNTILLSIVKHTRPYICNSQIRADLEAKGVIVSIGSACNTASPKASHVLYAMGADELIRKGALRITLGDLNTPTDVEQFINIFVDVVHLHQTGTTKKRT